MTTIDPETLRRIRRIEFKTRRLVRDHFVGAYQAHFKGRGIAFDAVRPYQPGDDVRDLDWNVTARAGGTPFIKRYAEERELTVLLMLDASASCFFGTTAQQKHELAAELGAVLALAAIRNNDKVGLLVFTDQIEQFTPPRKGRNPISRLIRDILAVQPSHHGTDIGAALRAANRYLKQPAILFLISDFLAMGKDYERELLITGRKHEVIALVLSDPRESTWDDVGLVVLQDAETNTLHWVDTGSKAWREGFVARAARFQTMRDETLRKAGVQRVLIPSEGDYLHPLIAFFRKR